MCTNTQICICKYIYVRIYIYVEFLKSQLTNKLTT